MKSGNPVIIIRASSLSSYADCARRESAKTFKTYIEDAGYKLNKSVGNVGAAIGTGVHGCMNYTLTQKMETGEPGSDSAANDCAIEALRAEAHKGIHYDSITTDLNQAEKQVLRKSNMFRRVVAPDIKPVAVEVRLNAKVDNTFELSGQVDYREEGVVGDLKTGKKSRYGAPQYGAYSLLSRSHGIPVTRIREHFMPTVPLKNPEGEPQTIWYGAPKAEQHAMAVMAYMKKDFESFLKNGDRFAFRSNASSMMCDPKYCPAFGTNFCKEHKGQEE